MVRQPEIGDIPEALGTWVGGAQALTASESQVQGLQKQFGEAEVALCTLCARGAD